MLKQILKLLKSIIKKFKSFKISPCSNEQTTAIQSKHG